MGVLNIWQEIVETDEQKAELKKVEDQNMEIGITDKGG